MIPLYVEVNAHPTDPNMEVNLSTEEDTLHPLLRHTNNATSTHHHITGIADGDTPPPSYHPQAARDQAAESYAQL